MALPFAKSFVVCLLAMALVAGCAKTPSATRSQLAGMWHGQLVTRSTSTGEAYIEDFDLHMRPDGRFDDLGFIDVRRADRPGQWLPAGDSIARVCHADYAADHSRLSIELLADPTGPRRGPGGAVLSAHLTAAGLLDYRRFTYDVEPSDPDLCFAIEQRGLLQRVAPSTQAEDRTAVD